jgi:peptidoglycan hydrolase CwlO-like protein
MKVSYLALAATGLIALSACGSRTANENAAANIRDAAQNQADALQNQASNVLGAAENRADALQNQASNITSAAENRADRIESAPSGGGAGGADTNGM